MRGATVLRKGNVELHLGCRAATPRRRRTPAPFRIPSLFPFLNAEEIDVFHDPGRLSDRLRLLNLSVIPILQDHRAICKPAPAARQAIELAALLWIRPARC